MAGVGSGYDLSTTTFSPDGRVFQLEYAAKAVALSGTTVGVTCRDGVVLAVEQPLTSKMLVRGSNSRLHAVDPHVGMAVAGIGPDGRHMVTRARAECDNFRNAFGGDIPAKIIADRVANFAHLYSLYWHVRPFGCAALIAAHDPDAARACSLYVVEPDGSCFRYFASAQGKNRTAARSELEKREFGAMRCRDAVKELATVIHAARDEARDKPYELEMAWLGEESEWRYARVPDALVREARAAAEEQAEDMED